MHTVYYLLDYVIRQPNGHYNDIIFFLVKFSLILHYLCIIIYYAYQRDYNNISTERLERIHSYAKGDNTRDCITEKMSAYVRNVYIKKIIILFVLQVKYLARGRRRVVQYNNIISIYGRYLSPPPCDTISWSRRQKEN